MSYDGHVDRRSAILPGGASPNVHVCRSIDATFESATAPGLGNCPAASPNQAERAKGSFLHGASRVFGDWLPETGDQFRFEVRRHTGQSSMGSPAF